jgi:hypothetical protein
MVGLKDLGRVPVCRVYRNARDKARALEVIFVEFGVSSQSMNRDPKPPA